MTISEEIQNLTSAVQTLTDAVKKLKLQSSNTQSCCPEPIYDCSTGNVTWIYPPADGGMTDGSTGDVTITDDPADPTAGDGAVGSDGTIGGYDGNAGVDHGGDAGFGIDYDDPSVQPPSTTGANDWQEFDDGLCIKANWVVLAVRDVLEQGMSITGWTAGAISSVQTLISIAGAVGIIGDTFVGVAIGASALTMSLPLTIALAVVASIASLLLLASKGAVLDLYDALREELVCAVYNGKSAAGIKQRWDSVITNNTEWFAPQRAWIKYLMTPDLAKGLSLGNPDNVADLPRYDYPCDCSQLQCVTGTWTGTDVAWFYGSINYQRATLIVWDSVTCAAINWNNDYHIGYKFTKYYDSEVVYTNWEEAYAFVRRCTADGGATLAGCSIRLITNTTDYPVLVYQGGNLESPITIPDDGTSVDIPATGNCNNWYVIGVVRPIGVLWSGSFTVEIQ